MAGENNNIRVTNAVLGVEMTHVKKSLDRLDGTISDAVDEMKEQSKRTTEVEKCILVLATNHKNLNKKVGDLADQNKKYNIGTAIGAGFAAVLATVLGILGMRN